MTQNKYFSKTRLECREFMLRTIQKDDKDYTPEGKAKAIAKAQALIDEEKAKPRATFHIYVDAQIDNCKAEMGLWWKGYDECPLSDHTTLLSILRKNFPTFDWVQDDGFDSDEEQDTDYCQYVYYPNPDDTGNYVLAVYTVEEIKEDGE